MSLRSKIMALIAAGTFLLSQSAAASPKKIDITPGLNISVQVDYVDYNVRGDEAQTTPVHPNDGGPSIGGATADIDNGGSFGITAGLEGTIGTEMLRLKAGGRIRYNFASLSGPEGYRTGIYEVKLQPLPSPYESYSYTKLIPDPFTFTSYAGIEISTPMSFLTFSAEVGVPYTGNTIVIGWDRFGSFETYDKTHDSGFGISYGGSIQVNTGIDMSYYLNITKEIYELEFNGNEAEIDAWVGSVGLKYYF